MLSAYNSVTEGTFVSKNEDETGLLLVGEQRRMDRRGDRHHGTVDDISSAHRLASIRIG